MKVPAVVLEMKRYGTVVFDEMLNAKPSWCAASSSMMILAGPRVAFAKEEGKKGRDDDGLGEHEALHR